MLTNFGKKLRKLRIDNNELLKDMASKLGVTVAYLSAVENGNREVPHTWLSVIENNYNISNQDIKEFEDYMYESKKKIKIDIENVSEKEKDLTLSFARKFRDLNDDQIEDIMKILKKHK